MTVGPGASHPGFANVKRPIAASVAPAERAASATSSDRALPTSSLEQRMLGEVEMVGRDRWEEIHRRAGTGASIRAIGRQLDLDRKTVRRCLRQTEWRPYERAARSETLLTAHAEYLRRRASTVDYSAQVLFQELRRREYRGSYETVKRFVRPLREARLHAR